MILALVDGNHISELKPNGRRVLPLQFDIVIIMYGAI
jgi:hypothetical protein